MRALFGFFTAGLLLTACPVAMVAPALHESDGPGKQPSKVGDPKFDRCEQQKDGRRRKDCEQDRHVAMEWVRRLSVDDQLCLAGQPMSDGITHRCQVRAFVCDVSPHSVKLEIREAPAGSRYEAMENYWYTEKALADLYLKSLGYTLEQP